ncbi:hypothetical protein [Curtobacterium sp. MCSS17_016]|uniref:hypothetical protein n=1 Tax=Curtobacterium sp. MCSS17_016 TaxID=2175644 RepID=UPI0011B7C9D5|nr:hypothetical protein [Curtobacterium sp. MCSS17_016]WIE81285.1 hypothetical protein DEJ19_018805 [Curtobacterium sp. MCSS17_016]
MRRTVIFLAAAMTVTAALAGCAQSNESGPLAASTVAETKSATPTPRPTYRTTVYTLASGEQVQVRSDKPVPDAIIAEIKAKTAERAATVRDVSNGFQQQPAMNSLVDEANTDYDGLGRTVMYFFGIREATGAIKWGVMCSGPQAYPASNLASNDRATALAAAQQFAEQQRAFLIEIA